MKTLNIYFTIFLAAIFSFQTTWAVSAPTLSYNDQAMQDYVKALNSGMKFKDVYGKIKVSKPKDQEVLKNILDSYGEAQIPVPKVDGNVMTFTDGKLTVQVEFTDFFHEKMKVNGYEADFSKYKTLSEKMAYATRLIDGNRHASLLEMKHPLISLLQLRDANASGLLILGAVVLVAAVAWGRVVYLLKNNGKLDAYDQMTTGIVTEANKCIREAGADSFSSLTVNFSCDTRTDAMIKIDDKVCFSAANQPNHTLADSMRACCQKDKKKCDEKFTKAFPVAPAGGSSAPSGTIYRTNSSSNQKQ